MFSESAGTLEKLVTLKAWAEVYVTAIEQDRQSKARPKQTNGMFWKAASGGHQIFNETLSIESN
jgi:hypothetical protein